MLCGLLGQVLARDLALFQRMQSAQQSHREAARGPEPRVGGDVRHADDFQVRDANLDQLERGAHDGMLHLFDRLHLLHTGVLDDQLLGEGLVERDIDVLIDGGRHDKAGVLAVVRRQVGAAAA